MRRWHVVLSSLVLVASAGFSVAGDIDPTTGAEHVAAPPSASWTPPEFGNVLWDRTHGVFLDDDPSGEYADLANLLGSNGYPVVTTNQGLDNIDLSSYVCIIICLGSAWYSPYTPSEVAAVLDFIANGGGVFVMADNSGCPNQNIQPITQAMGTTCAGPEFNLWVHDFAVHPIFSGVDTMRFLWGGSLAATYPSQVVAWSSDGLPVITASETGGMVVVGDTNFLTNGRVNFLDHAAFVLNTFAWLSGGPVATQKDTWGGVKSRFR